MEHQSFQPPRIAGPKTPEQALWQIFEETEFILSEDIYTLEERLADFVGAPFCVAVSDAASGVALSLACAGVGEGDSVLCAALGCAIPVQGIMLAGASPVFVDINPNTYTIDPYCVEYALGKLKRAGDTEPKALIATDIFGLPCNYADLEHLCEKYSIALIEDMSGAFGAKFAGKAAGSFGRFAVASFASSGPLDELGGGAVFCHDYVDAFKLQSLRRVKRQQLIEDPGAVSLPCMGSSDALIISSKLESCSRQLDRRKQVAALYRKLLQGGARMQRQARGSENAYSQLVVALPGFVNRARVMEQMYAMNIPCGPPACGKQTAYSNWNRIMLTNALAVSERLLSLPIHSYLSSHVIDYICRCLLEAIDTAAMQKT